MNPIYIKIEYDEAVSSKKQLLSSQINALNLIKKVSNYRLLRKKELAKKTEFKALIAEMKASINKMALEPPQAQDTETLTIETKSEIGKRRSIETELSEIKNKLEKLS